MMMMMVAQVWEDTLLQELHWQSGLYLYFVNTDEYISQIYIYSYTYTLYGMMMMMMVAQVWEDTLVQKLHWQSGLSKACPDNGSRRVHCLRMKKKTKIV